MMKRKMFIAILLALFLIVSIGVGYAFFTASVSSGDKGSSIIVTTGTLQLLYDEEPLGGEIRYPGDSTSKIFSVANIGDVATPYLVFFSELYNDFVVKSDLVYTLTCYNLNTETRASAGTCNGISTETEVPSQSSQMIQADTIYPGTTHVYVLTFTFKETGINQNSNQGRTVSTRITINELVTEVDVLGYAFDENGNPYVNKTIEIHSDPKSATTDENGYYEIPGIKVGDHTLIIRDGSSIITESPISITIGSKKEIIGKKVSIDSEVFEVPLNISVRPTEVEFQFDSSKTLLTNLIYSDYGTKSTIEAKSSPSFTSVPSTDEGLFAMKDENSSYSYYFRGDVQRNYVSFADKIWRIVRINGDGTIRMILHGTALDSLMSEYVVPYNSSSDCNGDVSISRAAECVKYGHGDYASTSIKGSVEEWYNRVIAPTSYAKYVVNQNFCNDYSYTDAGTGNVSVFGAWNRLYQNHKPSIACNKTLASGSAELLSLKVGLLTADEIVMAGGVWSNKTTSNYLYYSKPHAYTMSGASYMPSYGNFMFTFGEIRFNTGYLYSTMLRIRPVINLDAKTLASGTGTSIDPYIIKGLAS